MRKKLLMISIICLMLVSIKYTYSKFSNNIVGNIVGTSNNWSFKVNVENGSIENDGYKVPITNSNGQVNITLNTNGNSKSTEYNIELSGYNLPSDIKYFTDEGCTNEIENNIYNGSISKDTSSTITIYYKSSNTINGYLYIKVKARLQNAIMLFDLISKQSNNGVDSAVDFGVAATTESGNGNGLNIVNGTENNNYPIYYYRGEVSDNNVLFANFCWKIVRTTATGGTKLVYNGVPVNGKCNNTGEDSILNNISTETNKNLISFNEEYKSPTGVGYMYGLTTYSALKLSSYKKHLEDTGIVPDTNTDTEVIGDKTFNLAGRHNQNAKSSKIKIAIDKWYQENILDTKYEKMLEDEIWCGERAITSGTKTIDKYLLNRIFYYAPADRLVTSPYEPSLACSRDMDKYTVSSSNGNGDLTYPIGMLTADEINYAGLGDAGYSKTCYLAIGTSFYSMTPVDYSSGQTYVYSTFVYGDTERLYTGYPTLKALGVRPAVSLNNSVLFKSGDGTTDSPYIVE